MVYIQFFLKVKCLRMYFKENHVLINIYVTRVFIVELFLIISYLFYTSSCCYSWL